MSCLDYDNVQHAVIAFINNNMAVALLDGM
jgi:hypothetical protein